MCQKRITIQQQEQSSTEKGYSFNKQAVSLNPQKSIKTRSPYNKLYRDFYPAVRHKSTIYYFVENMKNACSP